MADTPLSDAELDRALAVAFRVGHPERLRILRACIQGPQSPKTMTSNGRSIGAVAYHFRLLYDRGLLEIAEKRVVRGAIQTFYRASDLGLSALRGRAG